MQSLQMTEFHQKGLEASQEPLRRNSTKYTACDDSDVDESNNIVLKLDDEPSALVTITSKNEKSNFTKSEGAKFVISLPPITSEQPFLPTEESYENEEENQDVDMKKIIQNHSMLPESFMFIEENHENTENNTKRNVQYSGPSNPVYERLEVNRVSYIILNILGQGGSSGVYRCYDVKTKSERAIKEVDLSDNSSTSYINEVKLLKKLQHCKRIIKMYDYEISESKKKLFVVLERGSLDFSKVLKKLSITNEHLPIHVLIYYWMEVLYAVQQIHENRIVHNDLKPENFIKVDDGLKLIDFGIATTIPENMTSVMKSVPMGSFNYISPEALITWETETLLDVSVQQQISKYKVSYKSDVWALGCILYQLVYSRPPFQHYSGAALKVKVIPDSNHEIEYPEIDWIPKKIIKTIRSCLQFDKNLRPTVQEIIQDYENIFNS